MRAERMHRRISVHTAHPTDRLAPPASSAETVDPGPVAPAPGPDGRCNRLLSAAQSAQQIGPRRMGQVVTVQLAHGQQTVDLLQPGLKPIMRGQRHGAVELDHQ